MFRQLEYIDKSILVYAQLPRTDFIPFKGTQTTLQKILQLGLTFVALPAIGPEWQLVWGPVVWKNKPDDDTTGHDNAWYIALHPNIAFEDGSVHPTYVIAIAGTPAESQYAWVEEKLCMADGIKNKLAVVPAKDVTPGVPYIATGTVNTVHLLLTTEVPQGAASAGTTLLDFITNLDQSASPRVVATGHSLGGAFSSPLSLTLVLAGVIPADSTLVYPSAGFSPGNTGFRDLFVNTFPARKSSGAAGYKGWNLNLVNTLDIIPQAWCPLRSLCREQNLGNIPPIYGTPVVPIVLGTTIVFAVHALTSGVLYNPLPSQYFTGSPPPSPPPSSLEDFLRIAVPQHQDAYVDEVGITIPVLYKPLALDSGLLEKSRDEKRFDFPLVADFEWAREHPKEAQKEIEKAERTPEARAYLGDEV